MTQEEILEQIAAIVAETVGLDTLRLAPTTRAADVEGWDSLANVQIFVAIEKRFGVRFRTGEIAAMRNIGELVSRIEERMDRPRGSATILPGKQVN
jgi:acyl carrier protein